MEGIWQEKGQSSHCAPRRQQWTSKKENDASVVSSCVPPQHTILAHMNTGSTA